MCFYALFTGKLEDQVRCNFFFSVLYVYVKGYRLLGTVNYLLEVKFRALKICFWAVLDVFFLFLSFGVKVWRLYYHWCRSTNDFECWFWTGCGWQIYCWRYRTSCPLKASNGRQDLCLSCIWGFQDNMSALNHLHFILGLRI